MTYLKYNAFRQFIRPYITPSSCPSLHRTWCTSMWYCVLDHLVKGWIAWLADFFSFFYFDIQQYLKSLLRNYNIIISGLKFHVNLSKMVTTHFIEIFNHLTPFPALLTLTPNSQRSAIEHNNIIPWEVICLCFDHICTFYDRNVR